MIYFKALLIGSMNYVGASLMGAQRAGIAMSLSYSDSPTPTLIILTMIA